MNELGILKLDIEDPAQGSNRKHAQSLGSIVLCSLNCDTFSCAHKKNKLFEATKKNVLSVSAKMSDFAFRTLRKSTQNQYNPAKHSNLFNPQKH